MKTFYAKSPAKLNIGLHILGRWPEGYHVLETLLVPYPALYDDLEVRLLPGKDRLQFRLSGIQIPESEGENYIQIAYWRLRESLQRPLPALEVRLHKRIPVSAGLGGGSSNSGTFLRLMKEILEFPLDMAALHAVAAQIGVDVPCFLYGEPMLATGLGSDLQPYPFSLAEYEVFVLTPPVPCSTKHIYRGLKYAHWSRTSILPVLELGPAVWREQLHNDLEMVSFQIYPTLLTLKHALYEAGAVYASMNGSGSSLYGLFAK